MKKTLPFIPPVDDACRRPLRREIYEQSVELYDNGQYVESFHRLLDYMNDGFRTQYGNADGTEFRIPHGSIVVHIRLSPEAFDVEADFLNLPEKNRVAMLRQVADLNINKLLLAGFVKEGDRLKMRYSMPPGQSHPHKMYELLQNICEIGDRYDDEFCTKFGATRCYEPQVTPYPAELLDRLYDALQTLGRETLQALDEYNAMRAYGYSWNVLDTTFYQIAYFAHPQGQLSNDLERAIDGMDAERPVEELVAKGTDFLKKLLATPKEQLAADLYFVDKLVSGRRNPSLQNVQEIFGNVNEEARAAIQGGNYERAAVRLLYIFYETYYYNDLPAEIAARLARALQEAGGQPIERAAEILYDAMDDVMEGNLDDTPLFDTSALQGNPAAQQMMEQAAAAAQAMQQKMQQQMAGEDMAQLQQQMADALAGGDMQEYARLAAEMQQRMMKNLFS